MTKSTITREQLLEIIETDHVQCGEASYLARMALAAIDSEAKEPISFDEWSRKCALQITLCHSDFREKAQYIWDSARATQQPAPVVNEDLYKLANHIASSKNELPNEWQGWAEELEADIRRAAMLQELQKSAGAEATCRSNENVQVLHTKSPAQSDCCPAQNHVSPEQNGDTPAQSQGWIPVSERMPEMGEHQCYVLAADFKNHYWPNIPNTQVGVYDDWFGDGNPAWDDGDGEDLHLKEVTHWMPLPAAPQEVKGE
ncbi:DUF551 domain-containing protein [Klebsiella michiganensis]|uniref:DUF551 domain-containing protein n=1 Tax=Klebsiella michiganensis TaxID=1134687 RepID=UPI002E7ACD0F|nr:DUF551 domain-containing protein [Klebsiella michiganensis]MEE1964689.1 DUF551 domain-containing protein [Klebsiella michiganensis]